MPFPTGARLGAYEVVGLLGAGGMGEVYRARDARLGRDVDPPITQIQMGVNWFTELRRAAGTK